MQKNLQCVSWKYVFPYRKPLKLVLSGLGFVIKKFPNSTMDITTLLNHVNPIAMCLFSFSFFKSLKILNHPHKHHHFKRSMNFYNRLLLTNGHGPYSPLYVCDQFLTMFHSLCDPLYIRSIFNLCGPYNYIVHYICVTIVSLWFILCVVHCIWGLFSICVAHCI